MQSDIIYRVGVVGVGVVGGALVDYLEAKTSHRVFCVDPAKGYDEDLSACDVVFVSVPVPTKNFNQDLTILQAAIERVPEGRPIIIRSTVLPGTSDALAKIYNRSFSFMPEFLTARRAYADMVNSKYIYVGVGTELQSTFLNMVKALFPDKDILPMDNKEAEMLKFSHNCFGALKVTYFNLIYELCKKERIDFNLVRLATVHCTGFINDEHTHVPGPDGKKGWGGKCYPSNVEAFIGYLNKNHGLGSKLFQDIYCLNRLQRGPKEQGE